MKNRHIAVMSIGLSLLSGHAGAEIVGQEKYAYDSTGNVIGKEINGRITSFVYEGNELRSDSHGTRYVHDNAGRLREEARDGITKRKFFYEYGGKVTRAEDNGDKTELYYNAEGHLVGVQASQGSEAFAWDGLGLALRGARACVIEGHAVGGVPVVAGGEACVTDYIGNTLRLGGSSYEGTVYGEGLEAGLFTGKPYIEQLGGYLFLHRSFSPVELRWTTADPSGFPDGPNPYQYVKGNPMIGVDPNGLATHVQTVQSEVPNEIHKTTSATEIIRTGGSGGLAKWFKVTFSGTGSRNYYPTEFPGVVGISIDVGCSVDDSEDDTITFSFGYKAFEVEYTKVLDGTTKSGTSGVIPSGAPSDPANYWTGKGGFHYVKDHCVEWNQTMILDSGTWIALDDPTSVDSAFSNVYLSTSIAARFKEYEP